jgi:transposase
MHERLAAGLTLQRVSDELDVSPDALRVWAKRVRAAPEGASAEEIFPGHGRRRAYEAAPVSEAVCPPAPMAADEEVRRLRSELERVRQERDFLKKAAAFFAKESR